MHTEELPIENTAQRQYIKKVHDALIDFLVVLMKTFRPKVEERRHLATFMISSEHNDIAGEVDLEGQQQQQHFNREGSTIHVVA